MPRYHTNGAARVVDLFCGMGGLSVAAREMGMRVVAGVDLNRNALKTFGRNFPEAEAIEGSVQSSKVLGRCRALLDGNGDGVRIVLSGPPCQGFSAACFKTRNERLMQAGDVKRLGNGLRA